MNHAICDWQLVGNTGKDIYIRGWDLNAKRFEIIRVLSIDPTTGHVDGKGQSAYIIRDASHNWQELCSKVRGRHTVQIDNPYVVYNGDKVDRLSTLPFDIVRIIFGMLAPQHRKWFYYTCKRFHNTALYTTGIIYGSLQIDLYHIPWHIIEQHLNDEPIMSTILSQLQGLAVSHVVTNGLPQLNDSQEFRFGKSASTWGRVAARVKYADFSGQISPAFARGYVRQCYQDNQLSDEMMCTFENSASCRRQLLSTAIYYLGNRLDSGYEMFIGALAARCVTETLKIVTQLCVYLTISGLRCLVYSTVNCKSWLLAQHLEIILRRRAERDVSVDLLLQELTAARRVGQSARVFPFGKMVAKIIWAQEY